MGIVFLKGYLNKNSSIGLVVFLKVSYRLVIELHEQVIDNLPS